MRIHKALILYKPVVDHERYDEVSIDWEQEETETESFTHARWFIENNERLTRWFIGLRSYDYAVLTVEPVLVAGKRHEP